MNQFAKRNNALITLPHLAKTRSGIEFDPSSNYWRFRDGVYNVRVDFSRVHPNAEPLISGIKGTLIYWLENYSPSTVHEYFNYIVHCLRCLGKATKAPIRQITAEDILNIKSSSMRLEAALGALAEFFRKWHRLGYDDISSDAIALLDQIKFKRYNTGQPVATLDPIKGPYTSIELEAIQSALIDAYANEMISRSDYLLFVLFISFGSRPVQIAMLKVCDLVSPDTPDSDYVLQIPRAKQRGVMGRDLFKARPLLRQIGALLDEHAESVRAQFKDILDDPSQAPLFPQSVTAAHGTASDEFAFHMPAAAVSERIINISKMMSVPSERLGKAMPLTARRFRYTFGTRAAEEGLPELVIAEMMDHSYPDMVRVYTALTDKVIDRIDRAVAMQMAPLAQAFKGRIIASPDEATIANSTSTIIDLRIDQSGAGVGCCGQHSYCGFGVPIACYTCSSFEPWLDGPHEKVLDYLLARRNSLAETTDNCIASINDRTILAVAEVVIHCNELKAKRRAIHE